MEIRRAKEQDIDAILRLLHQVLDIHAQLRPDLFRAGTTKYGREELTEKLKEEKQPIYVAIGEQEEVLGYLFCVIKEAEASSNTVPNKSIYIDDLCVDETVRGMQVGRRLFEYLKEEAKKEGCYEITLNVWEGNDNARSFYEKMGMKVQKTTMEYII